MSELVSKKTTINYGGKLLDLSQPLVMGILNLTPDSFYDGGNYLTKDKIKNRIEEILSQGGTIVDAGAFSSRPGADKVSEEEEIKRLQPFLEIVKEDYPELIISIDTCSSKVVQYCCDTVGTIIVNDISAGEADSDMFSTVAELRLPYIAMHMLGTPQTMQDDPEYDDVTADILKYFSERIDLLRKAGVKDVIIDPGFGFGKTIEDNYELMRNLNAFDMLGCPVLVGISRKSMIYKLLNQTPVESLAGTTALNIYALQKGANILRVHDVKEASDIIKINTALNNC